jgi:hypothetical protein
VDREYGNWSRLTANVRRASWAANGVVKAPEERGPRRTQPTVLKITPVLVVQHKLHNNTDDASGQRAERGQALLVLTLSSRVFTKGRMRESETRDGGISLERVGPPVLSQSRSAYRYVLHLRSGTGNRAAASSQQRGAGVVPEGSAVTAVTCAGHGLCLTVNGLSSSARDP